MIKKFAPLEPSLETVRPFEDVESGPLDIGPTTWPGWKISDEVWALETRGHSPDSVSFYLPGEKILYLGDETLKYFNCWLDSRATKVRAALELAMRLLETGTVKTIIGGHQQKPYEDAEAKGLLSRLLHDYDIMEQEIFSALNAFPQGATTAQIYGRLRKRKNDVAELRAFFEYEFPKMPVLLKTLVVGLLLENGCQAVGPDGKKKFTKR
jgi:glyoxylase-like metal-dependent hydrolase (beta-lactamase superfamily II)